MHTRPMPTSTPCGSQRTSARGSSTATPPPVSVRARPPCGRATTRTAPSCTSTWTAAHSPQHAHRGLGRAATDPDASPQAFAWALARNSLGIGRPTADVVVLVTMGRHVNRLMLWAEKERSDAAKDIALTERVWAALRGAVKNCLTRAATCLRASPSDSNNYKRVEPADPEELLRIVRNAAELLGKAGERYAQLLGEKDVDQEREGAVDCILFGVDFILSKAELPALEEVLLAIASLAMTRQ